MLPFDPNPSAFVDTVPSSESDPFGGTMFNNASFVSQPQCDLSDLMIDNGLAGPSNLGSPPTFKPFLFPSTFSRPNVPQPLMLQGMSNYVSQPPELVPQTPHTGLMGTPFNSPTDSLLTPASTTTTSSFHSFGQNSVINTTLLMKDSGTLFGNSPSPSPLMDHATPFATRADTGIDSPRQPTSTPVPSFMMPVHSPSPMALYVNISPLPSMEHCSPDPAAAAGMTEEVDVKPEPMETAETFTQPAPVSHQPYPVSPDTGEESDDDELNDISDVADMPASPSPEVKDDPDYDPAAYVASSRPRRKAAMAINNKTAPSKKGKSRKSGGSKTVTVFRSGDRRQCQNRSAQKKYREKNRTLLELRSDFNVEAYIIAQDVHKGLNMKEGFERLWHLTQVFKHDLKATCPMTNARFHEEVKERQREHGRQR